MMWEGIYTVNYVPAKDYLDRYRVICYPTAFEVCLMNFLELVSEGKQFLDVGDSATQIMQNLKTVFLMKENQDMVTASIFFSKKFSEQLDKEVQERCPYLNKTLSFDTEERFNKFIEKHSGSVKRVEIVSEKSTESYSYCSVKMPLAYMCDSIYDINWICKPWPSEESTDIILKALEHKKIADFNSVRQLAESLSMIVSVDFHLLLIVIQSLVVRQLIINRQGQ